MEDFGGWEAGALWEALKFDAKHYDDIDRLALVSDERWQAWMAAVCVDHVRRRRVLFREGKEPSRELDPKKRERLTDKASEHGTPERAHVSRVAGGRDDV